MAEPANPGAGVTPPAGGAPTPAPVAGISAEEFAEMKRQNDWMAKQIRELRAGIAPPAPTQNTAEATLTQRVKTLEEGKAKYAAKRRTDALRDAAKNEGVPSERVEGVVRYLLPDYGNRLKYDEDSDAVTYVDELEQAQPVVNLVKGFLKRPEGQIFLPAPQTAGAPRGGSPRAPNAIRYADMPMEDRLKLSPEKAEAMVKADLEAGNSF